MRQSILVLLVSSMLISVPGGNECGVAAFAVTPHAGDLADVKLLSAVYGYAGCLGVPHDRLSAGNLQNAIKAGCTVVSVTDAKGHAHLATNAPEPAALEALCGLTVPLAELTHADGMPATFSMPVAAASLEAADFRVELANGTVVTPACATLAPANEANEGYTVLLIGQFGRRWNMDPMRVSVRASSALRFRNVTSGAEVAARENMAYSGPLLHYNTSSAAMAFALLAPLSTVGESRFPPARYPNHCGALFSSTTHVLRTVWVGGVTLDGVRSITPNRTDLFRVTRSDSASFVPQLGLADLGRPLGSTAPDQYQADGDNFVDICLQLADSDVAHVSSVVSVCSGEAQLYLPKGRAYPACRSQELLVQHVPGF